MLSIIIPANNEENYIAACLRALLQSNAPERENSASVVAVEIIVIANGCTDDTVAIVNGFTGKAAARGWKLDILNLTAGGKLNALNAGERNASGSVLFYVDADVVVSPDLLAQIWQALDRQAPAYASGHPVIAPARSWVSRAYARAWSRVPFMTDGVPGFGVFAVNASGRARWGTFPDIISDDTFVRLQFSPQERIGVPATYQWPIVEGFRNLVRVRRRQDAGVAEITRDYPKLMENEGKPRLAFGHLLKILLRNPMSSGVYFAVALAVRLTRKNDDQTWIRGR